MRRLLLPTLSGVLYFLSWIGFGIWPLAFVCFLPLLAELKTANLKQSFWRGWWMGFVTHLGGYTWIMHTLRVFAFAPWPLAFLGYLAICAGQGLLFGVMSLALRWLWQKTGWSMAALLPAALVATEFAFPLLFQSYTGVALMPVLPLTQIADLGGPLLLSALQAVVNGALFDAWQAWREPRKPPFAAMTASLIALAASSAYGFWRMVRVDDAHSYHGWNWIRDCFLSMDKGTTRALIGAHVFKVEISGRRGPEIAEFSPAGLDLAQVKHACDLTPKRPGKD